MNLGGSSALTARLQSLQRRWPLWLAIALTFYSALLLTYATIAWQQMRQDATDYMVADNIRRATALGDLAEQLANTASFHADLYEIRSYLINRDLGMSPRYGLNASRAAVEERFGQLATQLAHRWNIAHPRIVYYSEENDRLADSRQGTDDPPPPLRAGMQVHMRIDAWNRQVEIIAPVMHKGNRDGMVVTWFPIEVFYRNLLPPESSAGYLELLLSRDGKRLSRKDIDIALDNQQLRHLITLADNQAHPTTALGNVADNTVLRDSLLVKTSVPNTSLILVTLLNEKQAYGHLVSRHVLIGAGMLLALMLLGAIKLDRMRRQTEQLEISMATAEQQRILSEFRNSELSAEIQRRKQVEKALAESQERWELAITGTNDGIWDWDIRTGKVFFSERWKSMLGYHQDEIAGHVDAWSSLLHPDDAPHVLAEVDRHLRGKTAFYQCEQRLRCKDGSYKWILDRGRALFDADGNAMRMAGSHTDISKQRAAEERIADRNAQLDAIFSLSPDAYVSFDTARRVKYANPAFFRMTDYLEADIIGLDEEAFSARLASDCLPITPFEGVAAMRRQAEEALTTDQRNASNDRLSRQAIEFAGPSKRVLELKLRLAEAATVSNILYLRDVTHEVEVDRMKSEFLSHAAHELRTPMASIYGFTELLIAQEFDPDTRKDLLQTIHKQTTWLIDIINELLDITRIEARRGKDFRIETVSVFPLVNEVLATMQINPARWPVTTEIPPNLPPVRADAAKLRQALTNVLGNAVKYSPNGGTINIRCTTRTTTENTFTGITITDHGIGMTPQQAAHVGERFFRVDTSGNIPGTGLGMAIAREVITLMGGSIDITSAPASGTTVTFWLPAVTP